MLDEGFLRCAQCGYDLCHGCGPLPVPEVVNQRKDDELPPFDELRKLSVAGLIDAI